MKRTGTCSVAFSSIDAKGHVERLSEAGNVSGVTEGVGRDDAAVAVSDLGSPASKRRRREGREKVRGRGRTLA